MNIHEFYMGKVLDAYEYLGCHVTENGAVFRTFAPAATRIAVIGSNTPKTDAFVAPIFQRFSPF